MELMRRAAREAYDAARATENHERDTLRALDAAYKAN
jgi:hypothetical protein